MQFFRRIFTFLFSLLTFWSCLAVAEYDEVRIGVLSSWPPYMQVEGEQYRGLDLLAAGLILEKAGLRPVFVTLPSSSRGWAELEMARIDMLVAASYTSERARRGRFSVAYRDEVMRIFWQPKAGMENFSLEQLMEKGLTLAVNPGAYYGPELERLRRSGRFEKQIVEVGRAEARFEMLALGRVDMVIDDEQTGLYLIDKHSYQSIAPHSHVVHRDPIFLVLGRHIADHALMARINLAIIANRDALAQIMAQK